MTKPLKPLSPLRWAWLSRQAAVHGSLRGSSITEEGWLTIPSGLSMRVQARSFPSVTQFPVPHQLSAVTPVLKRILEQGHVQ